MGDADLAQLLSDPIAPIGNLRLQYDHDRAPGLQGSVDRATFVTLATLPIRIGDRWNLVTRTFLPAFWQQDPVSGVTESGIGDLFPAFFLSPIAAENDLNWGAGVVFQLRTSGSERFANEKWGLGPTVAATNRHGPWTIGVLADHLWSVGGDAGRPDYSQSFLQPMVHYTRADAWTFGISSEAVYDWKGKQWSIPAVLSAAKTLRVGDRQLQFGAGLRYWAESPPAGPEGWGLRIFMTLPLGGPTD